MSALVFRSGVKFAAKEDTHPHSGWISMRREISDLHLWPSGSDCQSQAFLDGLAELIAEAILNEVREGAQILLLSQKFQTYLPQLDPNVGHPSGQHESQPREMVH